MSSMSEANLEKKFQTVSNTQDSIQSLSLWILHHKAHCNKIVSVWMKVLKKAKIGHRLTLFYLANDVIQNGRRKGATQFTAAFSEVLREAILLLKDDKIKGSIERVLRIWEDRNVFPADVISDLLDILSSAKICKDSSAKILAEFKPENVADYVQRMQKVEMDSANKLVALNSSKLEAATSEVLSHLKDRSHGQKFSKEFDDATRCLEDYIKTLEKEIKVRQDVIEVLEQAEIYYDTQRGEARVVANAYKNFAGRVKTQKKKLEELTARLPSPVPSPCADAPSPSNSEGLDLSPILEAPEASPPSPIGTPDGLKMSPLTTGMDKDPSVAGALNSFLPQAPGMMTSWLDSFATTATTPSSQASSLDSRLLNFMQKLPNIPSKPTKGAGAEPKTVAGSEDSMGATPVKDEHSGQGTPVQDEEAQNNQQQMLGGLMSITNDRSGTTSVSQPFKNQEGSVYSSDSANQNKFFNSLLDKDWRVPPPNVSTPAFQSTGPWDKEKSNSFEFSDTDYRSGVNVVGTPPWNSSGSFQMTEGNRTANSQVATPFHEPLQPPPKPLFPGFNIFNSPTFLTDATRESKLAIQNNKSASASVQSDPPQSRQDPRLNSQNYSKGQGRQEGDDTEIMDMDLADSDNEEENAQHQKLPSDSVSEDHHDNHEEETAAPTTLNVPEDTDVPQQQADDFKEDALHDESQKESGLSNDQPEYSSSDRDHIDLGPRIARPNVPYFQDESRAKFNPNTNLMSAPNHDRIMPPEMNQIQPINREREMYRGPMPPRGYPPMDSEERWRNEPWNTGRPREPPPWYGPRPRYDNNGHPFDEFGYNGRVGPYGPPPMKRFTHPAPYFGRERRGFFAPRHH